MKGDLLCIYESEKAIVHVYAGERTEEERRAAFEEAAKAFYRAGQRGKAYRKNQENSPHKNVII